MGVLFLKHIKTVLQTKIYQEKLPVQITVLQKLLLKITNLFTFDLFPHRNVLRQFLGVAK